MESNVSTTGNGSRFCREFVDIVHLILDGEATQDHIRKFEDFYMQCGDCISYYNLESSTIKFIKSKIQQGRYTIPDTIRTEIRSRATSSIA